MRIASIACFIIAGLFGIGAGLYTLKPSVSPLVTVVGAFAIPALVVWWGVLLWQRADAKLDDRQGAAGNPSDKTPKRLQPPVLAVAIVVTGLAATAWYMLFAPPTPELAATSDENAPAPAVARSRAPAIQVSAACPANARFLLLPELRERNAQYANYSDSELAAALVEVCYPSERPENLWQRLQEFRASAAIPR